MKNPGSKKKVKKIVPIIVIIVAVLFIILNVVPIIFHYASIESASKYAYETADEIIENDEYVIKKNVYEVEGMTFLSFYVEDKAGNRVFSSTEEWRAWDFEGIEFVPGSNDIRVLSSDVGESLYKFNGETWEYDFYAEENYYEEENTLEE